MDPCSVPLSQQASGDGAANIALANQLIESFTWSETVEGHAYWEQLYWAILAMPAEPDRSRG